MDKLGDEGEYERKFASQPIKRNGDCSKIINIAIDEGGGGKIPRLNIR